MGGGGEIKAIHKYIPLTKIVLVVLFQRGRMAAYSGSFCFFLGMFLRGFVYGN